MSDSKATINFTSSSMINMLATLQLLALLAQFYCSEKKINDRGIPYRANIFFFFIITLGIPMEWW